MVCEWVRLGRGWKGRRKKGAKEKDRKQGVANTGGYHASIAHGVFRIREISQRGKDVQEQDLYE